MKIVAAALLVLAALAPPAAAGAGEPALYTASTTGELVIDTQGRVVQVSLDRKSLGEEVMQGFERQIRLWRFRPVVRDGQPVVAKARVALDLRVIEQPGVDGMRIGFGDVRFNDPPEAGADGEKPLRLRPPGYPRDAMAGDIGARVNLLLRLDDEGRVTHAAAESVSLLGEDVGTAPARHARQFGQAAERAAARWRIPGIEGGAVVVPVRFTPSSHGGDRWVRTRGFPVDKPDWVALERASKDVVALGEGGARSSSQWKLLTPLDGA